MSTIVFITIPKYVASYVVQKLPKYVQYNNGDADLLHHSTGNFTNDSNDVPRWFGGHAQAVQLRAAFHVYKAKRNVFRADKFEDFKYCLWEYKTPIYTEVL